MTPLALFADLFVRLGQIAVIVLALLFGALAVCVFALVLACACLFVGFRGRSTERSPLVPGSHSPPAPPGASVPSVGRRRY